MSQFSAVLPWVYQIGLADIPILMIVVALGMLMARWMRTRK